MSEAGFSTPRSCFDFAQHERSKSAARKGLILSEVEG